MEMLQTLAKFYWLFDYHLSAFVGENSDYVKGRLKQLTTAGLISRRQVCSQDPACNWLTKAGLDFLGEENKTSREPSMTYYLHNKAHHHRQDSGCIQPY